MLQAFPLNSRHIPSRCEDVSWQSVENVELFLIPGWRCSASYRKLLDGNIKFLTVVQWSPILIEHLRLILFRSNLKDLHNIIYFAPSCFSSYIYSA